MFLPPVMSESRKKLGHWQVQSFAMTGSVFHSCIHKPVASAPPDRKHCVIVGAVSHRTLRNMRRETRHPLIVNLTA